MTLSRSNDRNSSKDFELIAGGPVDETSITLAIYGEDLVPEDISHLLCCQATCHIRRGELRTPRSTPYQQSAWFFEQEGQAPCTAEDIIKKILSNVSTDSALWQALSSRYEVQLRIAIHMENWNKGFDLSAEMIQTIARLGAKMVFDIYAYVDDEVNDALDNLLTKTVEK